MHMTEGECRSKLRTIARIDAGEEGGFGASLEERVHDDALRTALQWVERALHAYEYSDGEEPVLPESSRDVWEAANLIVNTEIECLLQAHGALVAGLEERAEQENTIGEVRDVW